MTLEEEAKLFRENLVCSTTRHIGRENYEYIEQAYLAGLYEGQPKWHDLRKDPKDYPTKEDMLIRVRLRSGKEYICTTYEEYLTEDEIGYNGYGSTIIYFDSNGEWVDINEVIAWCELPTLDKE